MKNGRNKNGQFAKGNQISTGRPPKGNAWADVLNELLDSSKLTLSMTFQDGKQKFMECDVGDGRTIKQAIGVALITKAIRGDVTAIRELADRTEGRPAQMLEIQQEELSDGFIIEVI